MKKASMLAVVIALALLGLRAQRGPSDKELLGLWEIGQPQKIDDELRFYYFHTGGHGLYRYGQVGYNQTRSFDWSISGDVLTLHFRKTGETKKTRVTIRARELELADDPMTGSTTRYTRRDARVGVEGELDLQAAGRMWIDLRKFATGGQAFTMYQLSKDTLPTGAKLGWFHAGDFDDWSTETLEYRPLPGALSFDFLLRRQSATTLMTTDGKTMTLTTDPRDFGARHRYVDAGPSF